MTTQHSLTTRWSSKQVGTKQIWRALGATLFTLDENCAVF